MPRTQQDVERTRAVVAAVLALSERMRRHYVERCEQVGLTPMQAAALRELAEGRRPMGELAGRLSCDASHVTGLTDRLEARGLVERQPSAADRRVKELVLTAAGRRLHRDLERRLAADSPLGTALSGAEQQQLLELLQRAVPDAGPCGPP